MATRRESSRGAAAAAPVAAEVPPGAEQLSVAEVLRRRWDGRYSIDPFGADAQLQDLFAPLGAALIRLAVEHDDRVPRSGPALLVYNRGFGLVEPTVLAVAMRRTARRRLRVVGAPDIPVLGDVLRKFGAVMAYREDLAALLRAGNLAGLALGATGLRSAAGPPPFRVLRAALGYPVIPVAIRAGGPLGLPVRPWRVAVGEPIVVGTSGASPDPLAAAELGESAREAVAALLAG